MIDAYTHLDQACADPIADMELKMTRAGVTHALAVETWKADNLPSLHQIMETHSPHFRVALCFRPVLHPSIPGILENPAVVALRVRTSDIAALGEAAAALQAAGKWLIPHAEDGIAPLAKELLALVEHAPGLQIYLPHLGWPTQEKTEDPAWAEAIASLRQIPGIVVGISAIPHFSREPFPHVDIERFAARLVETFGPTSVVAASDYPLIEKDRYTEYMQLAETWIRRADAGWSPRFDSIFSNQLPAGSAGSAVNG
jgi:hypothetical protein